MSLKDAIKRSKQADSSLVANLDIYLDSLSTKDDDRAINVNAPSQIGGCLRARFYGRTGVRADSSSISPRTRRVFDNGHHTHSRIQNYLLDAEILLMDEVPIHSTKYKIQGHTDGLYLLFNVFGVLEIKSINSRGFAELKGPKQEHVKQALSYLHCIEERRLYLREKYGNDDQSFLLHEHSRWKFYRSLYTHLKDGRKFTRGQKLQFQCELHKTLDEILFYMVEKPIHNVILLYENKDTQDLKEFPVDSNDPGSKKLMYEALTECSSLNEMVDANIVPPREGTSKSDQFCRWCNFKNTCWKK